LISDIEIVVLEGTANVDLQKTSYVEFEVENKGNGEDNLYLSIPKISIPHNWEISFYSVKNTEEINATKNVDFNEVIKIENTEPLEYKPTIQGEYNNITIILAADQTAYITLAITAPSDGKPVTETFKIYGESISDNIDTSTQSMSVKLRVSDLSITTLELDSEEPAPNQKVKITFDVKNNFHLPASNFNVNLLEIDGEKREKIDSTKISNLAANESKSISFTWEPDRVNELGYILKVELSGDIIPLDNSTPFRTRNVFVKEKQDSEKSDNMNTMIIIVSVIIVFIIILLIILRSMTRKKGEDVQEESVNTDKKPAQKQLNEKSRVQKSGPRRQNKSR
jgi:hypothetical protein